MNKEPIIFSILWDLEFLGRPNWESTQLTSIGKGPLNGPCKVWLMPCISVPLTQLVMAALLVMYRAFQENLSFPIF